MKFLVAYDGSQLAKSALTRAVEFRDATDADLDVVTVVPRDGGLARERGWLDPDATFDRERVESAIRGEVDSFSADVTLHCPTVEKYAAKGRIARAIRTHARESDVDVLFVGSESAGQFVTRLSSVGQGVAFGKYDLHVVRRLHPAIA